MRLAAKLALLSLPLFGQQNGLIVQDIFGRVLNQTGLTLVDWDGYMANPAIKFVVVPPANARFPATAVLTANEQRLYFDLPSTVGADGPRKTISFADASTRVAVYMGNAPDRDSIDGFFSLTISFVGADDRTLTLVIPVHEIDQDRGNAPRYRIAVDFSRDSTGFFASAANRAPIEQAVADWSYFFDDMEIDKVAAGQEETLIWNSDGFTSSKTVTNQADYAGTLLYVYGIHSSTLRSGGEPSAQGGFQISRGATLPLHRSGGVEIETAGNFNALGWLTSFSDARWWASANLEDEQNELFSIVHHESGHALEGLAKITKSSEVAIRQKYACRILFDLQKSAARFWPIWSLFLRKLGNIASPSLAFNPAQALFANFKRSGCLNDPVVMAYHGGACLKIDRVDHFDGETDDDSLFGAFGNEYHSRMPARRWFITKLDLLAAQAVGWRLRRTSAFLPASIMTASLPSGLLGSGYLQTLKAQGGIPFYNWTLAAGSLPEGLRLDSFSGVISGIPTRAGHFEFTVRLQEYREGAGGVTRKLAIIVGR